MPSVWDDLTDHQGQRCWEGTPRANSCMWSGVQTNQRCAHGRRVGPGVQGSSTVQRVPEERRRRGGSGKRGGGFRGLGLTQFTLVISPQEAPVSQQALERGDRHALRQHPKSHRAGVTPSIAPLACWLLSVPSSTSLLSLAPPLPCPFSPSSLADSAHPLLSCCLCV